MAKETIQVITEHYQKTFELTYELWKERNRLFVYLILATGMGLLVLLQVPEMNSLLVDFVVKILSITDEDRIIRLSSNFPLDVLLSILLVAVFYLMQKLYSTNLSVLRYYLYLGAMEDEIRKELRIPVNNVAFTREGKFYWIRRSITQEISKWSYVLVIFITLLPFIILKINNDLILKNDIITSVDITVSILTLLYVIEYARSAHTLDVEKLPTTERKVSIPKNSRNPQT